MHPPPPIDHTFKGGELSYMTLAMQREQNAYRSLLMLAGAVMANPEPIIARLVRGCIAMAFTARVPTVVCTRHRLADTVRGGCTSGRNASLGESAAYQAS